VASLHATSSLFARIDSAIFRVPFDVGMMGQTVHFKFCSFNIYGHAYQSLGSVTDYTHVLSNNNAGQNMPGALTLIGVGVTTASNTAFKSAQTSVWDSSVYSAQSYTNGCTVECFASQLTAQVMLGLTLNPSASNSYTNLAYAWYITNAGTLDIYESGASRGFTGTYTTSDLFAITYDGKHIVYYHNGAIVRSVPITGLTLFLQICFCELGGAVYGIEFSSQAPVSIPLTLLNFNGNSACVGTTAKKVGGTNGAWDTAAYSSQAYTNGCSLSCTQVAPLGADMMGLTLNPTASVSYTNLAYAFYMAGGTWNIYESGALALGGSTYTGATMFEIIHDGKHVAYYVAGSLVRSVPVSTTAFYMQICLGGVGDVVNNINWGPVATAVTPYTLVPMSANVACAGTRAVSTAGSGAFGTKNFQSKECYTGGATVSASVSQLTGALFVGFSTAPATGAAGGYGPVLAAWYPHGDSSICEIIFNNASLGSVGATPTLADVFTVTFDNFNFYWYRNNTLVLQMPYPYAGPLYLFGDFYGAGYGFSNIAFLPYSSSTPQAFIARGNHVVSDTSVSKSVNDGLWTSGDAYSINGYPTCHVVFKANQSNVALMVALVNLAPPASSNYTGLSYAIFCRADTVIEIYESSVSAGTYGNYTTADYLAITYDGTTLIYSKNGVALLTRTGSVGPLFADVDSSGAGGINSLEWGPGATIPLLDTAQVNPNAVTDVVSTTVAGPVNVYTSGTTCTLLGSITVPASNFASTHVVTVTGTVDHHAPGAQFSTCATISTTTLTSFSGSQDTWIARNASTGVPDTGGSWAKEKTFAAAAATAVTYYVYGYSGGVASTGAFANIYNIGIKAEVIKR
jgi:hypothetical protein